MAKNSKDVYGSEGSTNLLTFDPDKLVVVEDKKHPLYDERVHLPIEEAFVSDIKEHGVIEPAVVRKNPDTGEIEVVAGRRRVRAARMANELLKAEGRPTILVPAVISRRSDAGNFGVMISENEQRENDSPLVRAAKVRRGIDMGLTEQQLGVHFGVSPGTIKNIASLLDASTPVKNALESGRITATDGYKLVKLEPEEQKTQLEELLATAPKVPGKRRSKPRDESKPKKPALRSREAIVAKLEQLDKHGYDAAAEALRWVLCEPGVTLEIQGTDPVETVVERDEDEDMEEVAQ